MKDNNNNSKQVLLSVLGVAILVVAVVGVSFAAFQYSKTGEKVNTITTGTITMYYDEPENAINLVDALPITDESGKKLSSEGQYFDFTVRAEITGDTTINYAVTAQEANDPEDGNVIPNTGVKVYLTDMDSDADTPVDDYATPKKVSALTTTTGSEASGAPAGQYILTTGTFSATSSHDYRLRMWVADDYTAPATQQTYKLRVNVYGKADAQ